MEKITASSATATGGRNDARDVVSLEKKGSQELPHGLGNP
jgi:hypothetical protein